MKNHKGLAVVGAAVILLAMSGWSYATGPDPEREVLSNFGESESSEALETGGLPADPGMGMRDEKSVSDARTATIEFGGTVYRIGIDTP